MASSAPAAHRPVVIVGGGSAGLCVAAALGRRGRHAVVLDRCDRVGDTWRARYEELRLNTTRGLSRLPRTPFPRAAGRWPSRDDYADHLAAFAARHRLEIRHGTTVHRIDRAPGGWWVQTDDGALDAEHVVVATGRTRVPHVPAWPGRDGYTGTVVHVADLRRVADLRDARVLVVGGGNSGVDLATLLADGGAGPVHFSIRTPPTIMPLEIAGVPLQPLGVALRHLPERLKDGTVRLLLPLVLGDLSPFGLPAPTVGLFARLRTTGVTAAVDRGFARHLRDGRVRVVGDVERLAGDEVVLRGGERVRADVVVVTAGFRPGLEHLVGHLGVLDPAGRPRTTPGRPVPGAPGLWFAGFWPAIEGDLRQHPIEGRRIARRITRQSRLGGSQR